MNGEHEWYKPSTEKSNNTNWWLRSTTLATSNYILRPKSIGEGLRDMDELKKLYGIT